MAGPYEDGFAAAEKGDARAQFNLGIMYYLGQGVPQDYAAAVKWYRLAADQGAPAAQNHLASMFEDGHGVAVNYVQAYKWWNLAVSRFTAADKVRRDEAIKNRDRVAANMTPAQIADAQKLAREWKPTPAR